MPEYPPTAILLRHGETEWSATGRHTGLTDVALTERGEADARSLRDRLASPDGSLGDGLGFDLVLCSPLVRAVRTAELAGIGELTLDRDLVEWDYGDFEGRTTEEIRDGWPGWTIWNGPWRGGETIDEVAARADRVIARVLSLRAGATVALVAHGHVLRVLAARWIGAPAQLGRSLALGTGTISELGWEHETPVIHRWNT